jgi:hypothetical protein
VSSVRQRGLIDGSNKVLLVSSLDGRGPRISDGGCCGGGIILDVEFGPPSSPSWRYML